MRILLISFLFMVSSCASTQKAVTKDGSSTENAIKVSDVSQEYVIVRKLCADCKMKQQSLISNAKGTKHYDMLTLIKPNGEEVSYYFDITSFYGKW